MFYIQFPAFSSLQELLLPSRSPRKIHVYMVLCKITVKTCFCLNYQIRQTKQTHLVVFSLSLIRKIWTQTSQQRKYDNLIVVWHFKVLHWVLLVSSLESCGITHIGITAFFLSPVQLLKWGDVASNEFTLNRNLNLDPHINRLIKNLLKPSKNYRNCFTSRLLCPLLLPQPSSPLPPTIL